MKDILHDIVAHTHSLGFLSLVKIENDTDTNITSIAENKNVVMLGSTHTPVPDFKGTLGMPNLEKLALHLKNPEYEENATITVVKQVRGEDPDPVPVHIHFENASGDFQNDYAFLSKNVINKKLSTPSFAGANWEIEFSPSVASINRMKLMSTAYSEEPNFSVSTDNSNLVFTFGDPSAHTGEFVFEHNAGDLENTWEFPVKEVQSILSLDGDITMSIAVGVIKISVDSGLAKYDYYLPAQSK